MNETIYEHELKLRAPSLEALSLRLKEMGFIREKTVTEKDCYFNGKDHDFRAFDQALRIRETVNRQEGKTITLNFKGPKSAGDTREEIELEIEDGEKMTRILSSLGYGPFGRVEKEREYYVLSDPGSTSGTRESGYEAKVTVCLDRVKEVGTFAEIEILSPEKEDEAARQQLRDWAEKLGLDPEGAVEESYLELAGY